MTVYRLQNSNSNFISHLCIWNKARVRISTFIIKIFKSDSVFWINFPFVNIIN